MIDPSWQLIYHNPLSCTEDIAGFRMEGPGAASFPQRRLRLESLQEGRADAGSSAESQHNFVFWCPEVFPSDIAICWRFKPLREPGLAIMFLAAAGREGADLLDESLPPRTGEYAEYHSGNMNALHLSYFRRRWSEERQFHTCNLRKSYGFHLVAQGADPLPSVQDCADDYELLIEKSRGSFSFSINGLPVLQWTDDGHTFGPMLKGGRIGFRQMSPLIAEYSELKVYSVSEKEERQS